MTDERSENSPPESKPPPATSAFSPQSPDNPTTPKKLTAEEQMALYEEHLKETDWGHQPC